MTSFHSTFELIKQGAEAKLYKGSFLNRAVIVKERFKKNYRHPDLDTKLTKERMRAELRGIIRCKSAGIQTPAVYFLDTKRNAVYFEYIQDAQTVNVCIGTLLKECGQNNVDPQTEPKLISLSKELGVIIGKMHSAGIIHGDLTTSNILVKDFESGTFHRSIFLIDFGLSHVDNSAEDKGVDLYVLERALLSTHSSIPWFFDNVLVAYKSQNVKEGEEVYRKLEEIRLRGRKREMIG